jgi:hypothetical protein
MNPICCRKCGDELMNRFSKPDIGMDWAMCTWCNMEEENV